MKVSVKAPAKINLALDVIRKREDGYHEVNMVMTTVDLADRIELRKLRDNQIQVATSTGFLPEDQRNLAYQAARLMKDRFGIESGVAIYIAKHIPVAAGLAGGSSDAAATLRGLNRLWGLGLSLKELARLGAEIGSDISFCVYGGTALASGRGEQVSPLKAPPSCWVVLAKPEVGVSTADTYRKLKLDTMRHPDVDEVVHAINEQDYERMCRNLGNTLEEVTIPQVPEVAQIKDQMNRLGADGVLMSGSGPTVFGLTRHESKVQRIYNGLRGFCPHVYKVRLLGIRELE